jgi:hypothetical protein
MGNDANGPLRFVSYLFEFAVWPFQAVAKYEAQRQPFSDQHSSSIFLLPAFLLFLPLCLLIILIAMAYAICVVPIVLICQIVPKIAGPFLVLVVGLAVASVLWGISQGHASFSIGPYELMVAGVVIVILLGHQVPRLMRTRFRGFRL